MTPAHLVLGGVSAELGGSLILDQLSLAVAEREFVGIIGVSGGGKTTLLRTIARLLDAAVIHKLGPWTGDPRWH